MIANHLQSSIFRELNHGRRHAILLPSDSIIVISQNADGCQFSLRKMAKNHFHLVDRRATITLQRQKITRENDNVRLLSRNPLKAADQIRIRDIRPDMNVADLY